jgi:SAM-dependent methyltransferase
LILTCPYDWQVLRDVGGQSLSCGEHAFPVVHGVPVLLRADANRTHPVWWTTGDDVDRERSTLAPPLGPDDVDPFVRWSLVATCGQMYRRAPDPLRRYPIPVLELPAGDRKTFLDVGGNWGRWGLSAARRGYRVTVVDPSLRAALAGTRIAAQLGLDVRYVVAEARNLPFEADTFDVSFSYSVLQHLSRCDARRAVREMARVTARGGLVHVQLANARGLRQRYNSARGRHAGDYVFRVRPWTAPAMRAVFERLVGPTTIAPDSWFSLNARYEDRDILGPYAAVVTASRMLCGLARYLPWLVNWSDSLAVQSTKLS